MRRRPWVAALHIALAALVLMAPSLIRGRPGLFYDTMQYYRQGEYAAVRLHLAADRHEDDIPFAVTNPERGRDDRLAVSMAASRSPAYGLFLYLAAEAGTLWLLAALQALVGAWLLHLVVFTAVPARAGGVFWSLVAVLTLGTSLPFFTSFAMPDVFTGYAILAATLLLAFGDRLTRGEKAGVAALLAFAAAAHLSTMAALAILTPGACLILARVRPLAQLARCGGWIAASLAIALASLGAFQAAYRADTGMSQGHLPFVMARLLVDGPGRSYLEASCPGGASPVLCRFKDLPMRNGDDVLFDDAGTTGIFKRANYAERGEMQRAEAAFVLAAIRHDPWAVMAMAVGNWSRQLATFAVVEPLIDARRLLADPTQDRLAIGHMLPGHTPCDRRGGDCAGSEHVAAIAVVEAVVLAVSLAILAAAVWRGRRRTRPASLSGRAAAVVLLGVVVNAAVCGILSGPFDRYQARVVWLVPLLAVLSLARTWRGEPALSADRDGLPLAMGRPAPA